MKNNTQKMLSPKSGMGSRKEQQLLLMCSMEHPSYGVIQSYVQYNIHNCSNDILDARSWLLSGKQIFLWLYIGKEQKSRAKYSSKSATFKLKVLVC